MLNVEANKKKSYCHRNFWQINRTFNFFVCLCVRVLVIKFYEENFTKLQVKIIQGFPLKSRWKINWIDGESFFFFGGVFCRHVFLPPLSPTSRLHSPPPTRVIFFYIGLTKATWWICWIEKKIILRRLQYDIHFLRLLLLSVKFKSWH